MMSKPYINFIKEPLLEFANEQCEEHPKDGLYLYGPVKSISETAALKFGIIGCTEGLKLFEEWSDIVKGYIPAHKENVAHHTGFPGFEAVFGLKWPERPIASIKVLKDKVCNSIRLTNRHEAVKNTVDIYADAINKYLLEQADITPDFWFVVIPDEVFQWGRPTKAPPMKDRIKGKATLSKKVAAKLLQAPSLFEEDNAEADLQRYELNFHNQLKAVMLGKAVIQIVREGTLESASTLGDMPNRKTQDPATLAWNLCTTSYYKSSGPPWRLKDIRKGVCYVGIVFKKDPSDPAAGNACCGAQLFLSSGEGLVFRGAIGSWYSDRLKQFHLPKEKAKELMEMVIEGYENIHGSPPKEVFIHGKTRFDKNEWSGFQAALPESTKLVGIRIRPTGDLKLYRLALKPPARGTYMHVHERMAYLWTTGYVARFNTYPGFETPNPLAVNIDWGQADLETVVTDILALTKVNFNGCTFADGQPVTLKFADAIGEILTAAPNVLAAPQPFKYYI
tara:strand:+ start:8348 stop:9865 length:1518 start_codon:yes stop_codon:yes gene_type:complete